LNANRPEAFPPAISNWHLPTITIQTTYQLSIHTCEFLQALWIQYLQKLGRLRFRTLRTKHWRLITRFFRPQRLSSPRTFSARMELTNNRLWH
jgi:hypothetical protein